MGRPTLPRTLECIARQSRRPDEIVLVDAIGTFPARKDHDGIPIVFVQRGKLNRMHAANAGMTAARCDWLLILDEDDEIEPEHLADLHVALAREPQARAAYSQTRLVNAAGQTERIFGGPFNRMALFRSNYLSTHAVLFARSLVTEGCRYDDTFEMLEDWDFWLQVAMRTTFAFTARATAIYHAASGESGAGAGANLDREKLLEQRDRLMRKWATARAALALLSENG